MKRLMKEYMNQKKLLSVYTDPTDTSKFIFGELCYVDKNFFAITSYTPYGEYDGMLIKELNDVIKIEVDSDYNTKMKKIIQKENAHLKTTEIIDYILNLSKQKNAIISIELLKSGLNDVVGYVNDIIDDYVCVKIVNNYGFNDGTTTFNINDISQISIFSIEERMLEKLYLMNYKSLDDNIGDALKPMKK